MRSPDFWQALLSADLLPHMARAVLGRLGPSCLDAPDLQVAPGLSRSEKEKVATARPLSEGHRSAFRVISLEDAEYPENLRSANPPVALWVRGAFNREDSIAVAIVGTRKASNYGKAVAKKLAMELASGGITVVSGGAYGIDSAAHSGALEAGGRTLAVLGSGIDRPYPASSRGLFEKIAKQGAVVSQFAVGTKPDWWRFPLRNDTIVGLSRAVIVVEAPERSGALTTATSAAEHGRHLFVTPANMDSLSHRGSFRLINEGATLLYSPDQVFEALGVSKRLAEAIPIKLSETQQRVLNLLTHDAEIVDVLADKLDIPSHLVLGELTKMELDGVVVKTAGGYIRA